MKLIKDLFYFIKNINVFNIASPLNLHLFLSYYTNLNYMNQYKRFFPICK
jgi:hypothetical protein